MMITTEGSSSCFLTLAHPPPAFSEAAKLMLTVACWLCSPFRLWFPRQDWMVLLWINWRDSALARPWNPKIPLPPNELTLDSLAPWISVCTQTLSSTTGSTGQRAEALGQEWVKFIKECHKDFNIVCISRKYSDAGSHVNEITCGSPSAYQKLAALKKQTNKSNKKSGLTTLKNWFVKTWSLYTKKRLWPVNSLRLASGKQETKHDRQKENHKIAHPCPFLSLRRRTNSDGQWKGFWGPAGSTILLVWLLCSSQWVGEI